MVKYIEWFESKKNMNAVSKFISHSTLKDMIEYRRREFTEADIAVIMKQLFEVGSYLHENNVVHMNIVPNNVMVSKKLNLTLIDFGVSRLTERGKNINIQKDISQFTAPESYDGEYSPKSDVWSLGNLMYFLFSSKMPFSTDSNMISFKKTANKKVTFKSG